MAGNKMNKYDRGSAFQRRFNERYKENVFEKLPKRPFFLFLEVLITKIGRLILLNLMYCVFAGPYIFALVMALSAYNEYNLTKMILFTLLYLAIGVFFGPATAAVAYIMRKFIADETVFLVNDFMEQMKKNFKQGAFMGLFDSIYFFGVMVYLEFMLNLFASGINISLLNGLIIGLLCLVVVIYFTMRYYVYMMMVTIELSITDMMRNAIAFVFLGAPTNLFVFLVFGGLALAAVEFIPYSILVLLAIGFSFVGLIMNFNAYRKIKKHLVDPVAGPQVTDDGEKIFSDEPTLNAQPAKKEEQAQPSVEGGEEQADRDMPR